MLEKELHERLAGYISGELSLHSFQDWFVPATWDARQTAPPSTIELIREIDLRLAEYTNGHVTDGDLKDRLARILISVEEPLSNTSSNIAIIDWPEMQIRSVHIGLAAESELQTLLDA